MHNTTSFISLFRTSLLAAPLCLALAGSAEAKSIGKDQVNIRSEPSTSSAVLFTAPLGYPIKIQKENGDWVYFRDWQNNTGWVHKPLVSNVTTAVVLVDKANIRSSANTKASVVATAEMGEIYTILGREGNWVKLGYYHSGTEAGWMRNDLLFGH